MKSIKILSTVLIVALSLNAFADLNPKRESRKAKRANSKIISIPVFEWGNYEDVNSPTVADLKNYTYLLFDAPEDIWGNPEELNNTSIENLKNLPLITAPTFVWGDPVDLNLATIEKLKSLPVIPVPVMVWGNPEDVETFSLESTKEDQMFSFFCGS